MRHRVILTIGAVALLSAAPFVSAEPPLEKPMIHGSAPLEYAVMKNPLKKSPEMLLAGKLLYEANCAPCHGVKSDGKGVEAAGFWPPPADFKDPQTIATLKESYMFWRIKEGGLQAPFKSAMPAYGDLLTDAEIWQIINYEYENAGVAPKAD